MNKIDRAIRKFECVGLRDDIADQYVNQDMSLRELETFINTRFVKAALQPYGNPTERDPETITAILSNPDDYEPRTVTRVETQLQNAGVDVEELQSMFITYRTVKNYLNKQLDIDTSVSESIDMYTARQTISWAKSRCEGVITTTLQRMMNAGLLEDTPGVDVTVEARVMTDSTDARPTLTSFIESHQTDAADNTDDTDVTTPEDDSRDNTDRVS
jgi:hypothetical protein